MMVINAWAVYCWAWQLKLRRPIDTDSTIDRQLTLDSMQIMKRLVRIAFGFMLKMSTLTNPPYTQKNQSSLVDANQDVGMVLLDLSKAFNVVNYFMIIYY